MSKETTASKKRPFVLIIRDGWGYNPNPAEAQYNALKVANTPVDDMLMSQYPHCLIRTSGLDVGLPAGTMGNSEVGHQNIGAGRIVPQESVRLTFAINDGLFFQNEEFCNMIKFVKAHKGKMHVMGLCSDIGVHSELAHLYGLLKLGKLNDLDQVYIHAFTDGRDSPPDSGLGYIAEIEKKAQEIGIGKIASVGGRFYAMDRDNRYERVEKAYNCLRYGKGPKAASATQAVQNSYDNKVTDEFIEPVCIVDNNGKPVATIDDGDGIVFFNFRGDRTRQITRAFIQDDFISFERATKPDVYYVCMTEYDSSLKRM